MGRNLVNLGINLECIYFERSIQKRLANHGKLIKKFLKFGQEYISEIGSEPP